MHKLRTIPGITRGAAPLVSRHMQVITPPKGRMIQGLPITETTRANQALASLLSDFPLPIVPEYLWGRSNRRERPVQVLAVLRGRTDKAWKVNLTVMQDDTRLTEQMDTWLPKGNVFLWAFNHPFGGEVETNLVNGQRLFDAHGGLYRIWIPMWLYRRKQLDLPPDQRVQSSRS